MERVAKKKAKHLEEEEMAKAARGIWQGEKVCTDEEERTSDTDQNTDPEAKEELPCEASDAQSDMDLENMIIRSWMNSCYRPVSLWWK